MHTNTTLLPPPPHPPLTSIPTRSFSHLFTPSAPTYTHEPTYTPIDILNDSLTQVTHTFAHLPPPTPTRQPTHPPYPLTSETAKVLITVTASSAAAEHKKREVQVIKDRAQAIVDAIDKDKTVAEAKLTAAVPALEAAERALQTITAGDISTVKKLGKPPHLIKRIMDVVVILFRAPLDPVVPDDDIDGRSPVPTWNSALKVRARARACVCGCVCVCVCVCVCYVMAQCVLRR
jgi:hypothetical protein